jgi:hypothetical protein
VLAEGFVIHEETDEGVLAIRFVDPARELLGRERPLSQVLLL